ncbi:MAG: fluoride efflux transporter CrcB [Acidimicrobiales bacterium]
MPTVLVAIAGAIGAVVRYRIAVAVGVRTFPWATLGINISGCLVLAFVLAGPGASRWSPSTTTAVAVGFIGAYTTFSTFGYETFELFRTEQTASAVIYVVLSLLGGLVATAVGYAAGKVLA